MSNDKQPIILHDYDHGDGDDAIIREWVDGLPEPDTVPELTQLLAPPELANAFCIPPLPIPTSSSIAYAVDSTMFTIFSRANAAQTRDEQMMENQDSGKRKMDKFVGDQEHGELTADEQQELERNKKQRVVWTPKLHKRFVDVIKHLGMTKAVPKTILQLMNVEGLTRENVASHLQKYRLYLQTLESAGTSTTTPRTTASELHGMTEMPTMPVHGAEHYHMMMQQHPHPHQQQQHPHPYPHQQQQHPHPYPHQQQQYPHPYPHQQQQHPHPYPHQQQHPHPYPYPHQQQQHPHPHPHQQEQQ